MTAPSALRASDSYEQGLALSAKGRHGEAIEQFERALATRPDDARVLFALGNTARALGLSEAAESFFNRVLAIEPGRLEALVNLANLLRSRGQFDAAIALLEPALSSVPQAAEIWLTLGSAYREKGDRAQAEHRFRQALAIRADYAPALGNLADIVADRGETDEALSLYERAIKRDPHNSQMKLNRAILHLLKGNLKDGWRDYAARLKIEGKTPETDHNLPRWEGGPLKNKRLLVTAEQGVGDHIMFASTIPGLVAKARAEGGSVLMDCDPRLVPLFARSFPDVTVKPQKLESRSGSAFASYGWLKSAGGANAAIEMGSLPRYLRSTIEAFPNPHTYLRAGEAELRYWRNRFSGGPRIGICWRSGKTGGGRSLQYAPRQEWAEFLRDLPGTLVCLQYDAQIEEVRELEALSGRKIVVPENIDQKNELDRACALLRSMDAVVSAPTAVSWLAAAAGTPVFKALYDSSWTSFGAGQEPFAPSAICMTPRAPGGWRDVFGTIRARIANP